MIEDQAFDRQSDYQRLRRDFVSCVMDVNVQRNFVVLCHKTCTQRTSNYIAKYR